MNFLVLLFGKSYTRPYFSEANKYSAGCVPVYPKMEYHLDWDSVNIKHCILVVVVSEMNKLVVQIPC